MKKTIMLMIMTLMLVSLTTAFTGSGAGTEGDPYVITTCEQLQEMEDDLSAAYVLGNNIDCSATTSWNSGQGFTPVGYWDAVWNELSFTGTLDGQDHVIKNLFMNWSGVEEVYVGGLFGSTNGATIANLHMTGADINFGHVDWGSVGILVGYLENSLVENLTVQGIINNNGYVGEMGGVFGNTYSDIAITNIHAEVALTGTTNSMIIGGLVASSNTPFYSSSAAGNITATDAAGRVGGLSGSEGHFYDSYSQVNIYGDLQHVGGLVGISGGIINRSYSSGIVTTGATNTGGLVGYGTGTVVDSYYDTNTSGQNDTGKGTPKTTTEMMQEATFANWDFVTVWSITEGLSYPYLLGVSEALPDEVVEEDEPLDYDPGLEPGSTGGGGSGSYTSTAARESELIVDDSREELTEEQQVNLKNVLGVAAIAWAAYMIFGSGGSAKGRSRRKRR